MIRVNIAEAKAQLSKLVQQVQNGETVVICNHNVPVAQLNPIEAPRKARILGLHDGWFSIPDEVFAPMSDEEADEWETPIFGYPA